MHPPGSLRMSDKEVIKKFLLLLVSLMFFAALTIPVYFLMTAGAKKDAPDEVTVEPEPEEIDLDNAIPGQMGVAPWEAEREALKRTTFMLNKGAFFGGFALIIVLYVIYYVVVLRNQFYPFLAQSDPKLLIFGLLPFLLFMVAEVMEILLVPTHLTKRLASFTGLNFEIAYILLAFFLFFTLIGTFVDTNLNRVIMMDGVPFRYARFGNGPRNLVLIPGLSMQTMKGQGMNMAWMYRMFSKEYSVFVMDKKDEVEEDVTLEELAEDIYRAMDENGILSADVVGISQGGMIAQYLALNHPEIVDRLVLGVTASRMNETLKGFLNRSITYAKKGEMEKIMMESFENDFTEEYTKKFKPFLPILSKMAVPKSNTRFIRLAQSIYGIDTYDRLGEIGCPVFVIAAGKDKVVTGQASLEIAEKLNCQKYDYRRLAHGAYSEAKDFNERIYKFLMRR